MVVLNILISVYHAEPEFFDDWSAIHLIARLLINWIAICMYTKMEYCFKSPLKNISNGLNEIKKEKMDLHHLKVTSMIIVTLDLVVPLR